VEGFPKYKVHRIGIEPRIVTGIVVAEPLLSLFILCVGRIEVIMDCRNLKSFPIDSVPEGDRRGGSNV